VRYAWLHPVAPRLIACGACATPAAGAHKAPAYLKVHPFGQLPAITCEDGTAVFESGAVILYLADKFDKASQTPEARAAAASWVLWSNSSFAPAVFGPSRAAKLPGLLAPLEAKLKASPYMLGSQFTVADIAVGAYLAYTKIFFGEEFKQFPVIKKYLDEIEKRPAFHATIGSE
jgi:glutathione S-transferase